MASAERDGRAQVNNKKRHLRCYFGTGLLLAIVCALQGCAETGPLTNSAGALARGALATTSSETSAPLEAVVLFIGDGMGISTVTAGRIYAGQKLGLAGEEHLLKFEHYPDVALIKTYNTDLQVPDSAGTMSAIVTGIKTRAGVLSIAPSAPRGDCSAALANPVETLLEKLEGRGYRTGIVSTATITHATPAAGYAHSADRNWESDADMPEEARAAGCRDIASQLVEFAAQTPGSDGVDVILGGGRANFFPTSAADTEYPDKTGNRADGRDLSAEWLNAAADRSYVWNTAQFEALSAADTSGTGQVLGLFEPSHMQFNADRNTTPDGEPSLAAMTKFAIDRLRAMSDGKPFLLIVEAGRIDHAHHGNNAYRAMEDTIALDDAVKTANAMLSDNALVIVTADHSHTFTISGYPKRGNPMLGLVRGPDGELLKDITGRPYTTLGYANGSSAAREAAARKENGGEPVTLTDDIVQAPNYQQTSTVALRAETHAGEDVAAYATGPGSTAVRGVMEQNRLYNVMADTLLDALRAPVLPAKE